MKPLLKLFFKKTDIKIDDNKLLDAHWQTIDNIGKGQRTWVIS